MATPGPGTRRRETGSLLASTSVTVAEVPWTLEPTVSAELTDLDLALRLAQHAHETGDGHRALDEARRILERAGPMEFAEPTGQAELARLTVGALALMARALGATMRSNEAIAAFRSAVNSYLEARATHSAAGTARGPAPSERPATLSARVVDEYRRWRRRPATATRAVYVLEDALKLAPNDPVILAVLAGSLESLGRRAEAAGRLRERAQELRTRGRYGEALAALDRALPLDPAKRETTLGRADLLRLAGRWSQARDAIRPLLVSAADDPRVVTIEGLSQLQCGALEEARESLTRAAELAADEAWAHGNLALALQAVGRREDAARELERATSLDANRPTRLLQKAVLLADEGQLEEALEIIGSVLAISPGLTIALLIQADVLVRQGAFAGANTSVDDAIQGDPQSPLAWATKGRILRDQHALVEAEGALARAGELDPALGWVQRELGEIRAELNDLGGAADAFGRALALDRDNVRALCGQGEVYRRLGQLEQARTVLDHALRLAPDSAEVLTAFARLLYSLGELDLARERLRRALELDFDSAEAHAWSGEVLRMEGKHEEALEELELALQLDPRSVFSLGTRGQVLVQLRRLTEGVADLRATVAAAPELVWAREALADGLRAQGEYDAALVEYERLRASDPDSTRYDLDIARIHESTQRYEQALQVIDEVLERHPADSSALVARAHLHIETAQFESAIGTLDAVLDPDPEHDFAVFLRGWAHRNLGPAHVQAARADFIRAIELDERYPDYHQKLGELVAAVEGREAARPHFERVLERVNASGDEPDPFQILVLGWAHAGLGHFDFAARVFRRVLAADPDDTPTRFDLALALLASGRARLAQREYRQAIKRAQASHPLRRRCLLLVASRELDELFSDLARDSRPSDEDEDGDVAAAAARIRELMNEPLRTATPAPSESEATAGEPSSSIDKPAT